MKIITKIPYLFIGYLFTRLLILDIYQLIHKQPIIQSSCSDFVMIFYKLCEIVLRCVQDYFVTFRYCWCLTLQSVITMIDRYIWFLDNMVYMLTTYPMCLYGTISIGISLFFATMIIRIMVPWSKKSI